MGFMQSRNIDYDLNTKKTYMFKIDLVVIHVLHDEFTVVEQFLALGTRGILLGNGYHRTLRKKQLSWFLF